MCPMQQVYARNCNGLRAIVLLLQAQAHGLAQARPAGLTRPAVQGMRLPSASLGAPGRSPRRWLSWTTRTGTTCWLLGWLPWKTMAEASQGLGRTAMMSLTWMTMKAGSASAVSPLAAAHSGRLMNGLCSRGPWLQAQEGQGQEEGVQEDARPGCRAGRQVAGRPPAGRKPGPSCGAKLPLGSCRAPHHGVTAQVCPLQAVL